MGYLLSRYQLCVGPVAEQELYIKMLSTYACEGLQSWIIWTLLVIQPCLQNSDTMQ